MDEKLRVATLERVGPPDEELRPTMGFMVEMYSRFQVELDALVGRSALDRPYNEQQLTIAEEFYRDVLGRRALLTEDLMEVNRTLMNIASDRAILDPDRARGHRFITGCQKNAAIRLTPETHDWLCGFAANTLATPQRREAMEVGLIDADLGKSEVIQDDLRTRFGWEYADHDRLLVDLMSKPGLARRWTPSFYRLPEDSQATILNNYRSGLHVPQAQQGESPAAKFVKFLELPQADQDFGLLLGLLDIAGAEGDRVQNGSVTLNEPVVSAFRMLVQAVRRQEEGGATLEERALFVEREYLRLRAVAWGLDVDAPNGRALARLGCNLRFSRPKELQDLVEVIDNHMAPQDRANLLELLNYTGLEPDGSVWIMYLPALIRRYAEELQKRQVPPVDAWDIALTLAARTYQAAKEQIDISAGVVVVAGPLVKSLEKDPATFLKSRIHIHSINETEARAEFVPIG